MGKITKNLLILVVGSIITWLIIVAIFQPSVFKKQEKNDDDNNNVDTKIPEDAIFIDGTYEGATNGHNGPIVVEVTIENEIITKIVIVSHSETAGIADPALTGVPAAIVAKNSPYVDGVTEATVTSNALMKAVENALRKAIKE